MGSGLRPIHSVDTITCTSEISGTASSGVRVIAQMPQTVTITVAVNTRNRLAAHQSMIRSIMVRPSSEASPFAHLACDDGQLLACETLPPSYNGHCGIPPAGHHHLSVPP